MSDLLRWSAQAGEVAWPAAFALAWLTGEIGHHLTGLPRISLYGLMGFALGRSQIGLLPLSDSGPVLLLANMAFGLVLFELGYRVNLRWLRVNPWIALTSVLESAITFGAVYCIAIEFGTSVLSALLLASLAMATSPASLIRVVNEQHSSGQVTERAMHLTAVNCAFAVFAFKSIVGFWTYQNSGSVSQAMTNSFVLLVASIVLGAAFGVVVSSMLRLLGRIARDATVCFAIGVILLVAIAHAFKLSPVLGALSFGLVARQRRMSLNQAQRNFGAIGDLLTIVLFVFAASTIEWHRVVDGLGLALALIAARTVIKVAVTGALAHVSGISTRAGILTGLTLTPISVIVILLLEQARYLGIDLIDQLAPLAAMTLLLELFGPVIAQRSLIAAGEFAEPTEG